MAATSSPFPGPGASNIPGLLDPSAPLADPSFKIPTVEDLQRTEGMIYFTQAKTTVTDNITPYFSHGPNLYVYCSRLDRWPFVDQTESLLVGRPLRRACLSVSSQRSALAYGGQS
jgi:hypothetical protein